MFPSLYRIWFKNAPPTGLREGEIVKVEMVRQNRVVDNSSFKREGMIIAVRLV